MVSGTLSTPWNYSEAFSRNIGLMTPDEQEMLRGKRVAVIGMGGVGGGHLMTLARMGIGSFVIADPDSFELANFNRQYGANIESVGRLKVEVMAEQVASVNPDIDLRVYREPVGADNIVDVLDGVDLFVDGIDFFSIDARRLVFDAARERGIWGITAGPIAFGAAWISFSPTAMTFDEYFDIKDSLDEIDKLAAFAVGLTPAALHLPYADLRRMTPELGKGASSSAACFLAAGVVGVQSLKILLQPESVKPAPHYCHFDAYRQKLVSKRLRFANRNPLQLLKRKWVAKHWRRSFGEAS